MKGVSRCFDTAEQEEDINDFDVDDEPFDDMSFSGDPVDAGEGEDTDQEQEEEEDDDDDEPAEVRANRHPQN